MTSMTRVPGRERAVFFVSDSTGITAETLGNALLANFPGFRFHRHTTPFVTTAEEARAVVRQIEAAVADGLDPIVFTTIKTPVVTTVLEAAPANGIDLIRGHLNELEHVLGETSSEQWGQFHTVGDADAYFARMRAVEYAIEHDDGHSERALELADVILIAPSRCGKTPTTMYLALQYGMRVANYPLTDDDFIGGALPRVIAPFISRCFGMTTTPLRLSQIRHERLPDSTYASLAQCTREIRRCEHLYRSNAIPFVNSSAKSVEEMSAVILQSLKLRD